MNLLTITIGIIALFVISFLLVVWKTKQLNVDPLQDALAVAIEALNKEDHTPDAQRHFSDVAAGLFYKYRIEHLEIPLLRLRLVHSLSLLRHRISTGQFRRTERYLLQWQMPQALDSRSFGDPTPENKSAERTQVFISYAREDQSLARIIAARLEAGGCSVWWDDGIGAGNRWEAQIKQQLESAAVVLVLWSPFASVSEWVRNEAKFAKDHGKLIPVFIGQCRLPSDFSEIHTLDLINWNGDVTARNWQKLIAAINNDRAELQPSGRH